MRLSKSKILAIIITLIVIGAFLRFFRVEILSTYLTDQAQELLDTLAITRGDIKLIGIKTSLSEVRNGAVMNYLLVPFVYLFNFSPIAGSVLQSLLSLATIPIAFLIGKKAKNNLTGLLAASIISLSPLLVEYSRQTQLAYYPLLFSALAILLLLKIVDKFDIKIVFFLGILLGFILQVHYLAFTLIVLSIITLYFFSKNKLGIPIMFIGLIIGLLPMIVFELTHQFFNSKMLLSYLGTSAQESGRLTAFSYFPELFSRLVGANNIILGWGIFLLCTTVVVTRKLDTFSKTEKILLLHILISIITVIVFNKNLIHHYLLPSFVSIIVITCSSIIYLAEKNEIYKKPLILFGIFLIIINIPSYRLWDNNGANMSVGWNLLGVQKAASTISQDLDGKPFNVAMLVDAQNQGYPLRYLLEVKNKKPLGVADYDKASYLYVIISEQLDLDSALSTNYELNSFGGKQVDKVWDIQNGFKLIKLTRSK